MLTLFNKFRFYSPEESGGNDSGELGKEDMIEFLNTEDDEEVLELPVKKSKEKEKGDKETEEKVEKAIDKSDKEEEESDEEESEDEDELAELEEELEGPDEEQLELMTPVRRRDILKKYPELFKDFPYLERAYYREQQFTEIVPTIEDARKAVEKSHTLDKFEEQLMSGSTKDILSAVKETDKNAFYKIVDNYMPTLGAVDEAAMHHVIGNTIKQTIMTMVTEGNQTKNDALITAANILHQFVFGTAKWSNPTALSNNTPTNENKTDDNTRQQQAWRREQLDSARDNINTKVNNILTSTIEANIDPKSSMTDYIRKTASREALETLKVFIEKDSRFKILLDKLWENALRNNYNRESMDRVRSAYLSKAKTLLPSVIKKARNEALRGLGKRVKDDDNEPDEKKSPSSGRPQSNNIKSGKNITDPKDIPRNMRTIDFLNS